MIIKSTKTDTKGFTLIELLVVIAVIGILATLVLLQLGIARAKARDTKRIVDISQIRSAMELFYDDNNGHYPAQVDMSIIQPYVPTLPQDPLLGQSCGNSFSGAASGTVNCYGYAWDPNSNPLHFQIWTELEYSSNALSSDDDIDSTGWSGALIDGSDEVDCYNDTPQDCIFDVGVAQ